MIPCNQSVFFAVIVNEKCDDGTSSSAMMYLPVVGFDSEAMVLWSDGTLKPVSWVPSHVVDFERASFVTFSGEIQVSCFSYKQLT